MYSIIVGKDLLEWMDERFELYASELRRGEKITLLVNCKGKFKVIRGLKTIYTGTQLTDAISAWKSA